MLPVTTTTPISVPKQGSASKRSRKMKRKTPRLLTGIAASVLWAALPASAFDSGSNGEDGALAPTGTGTFVVVLPDSGVLQYTTIDIPQNLTVKFQRNTTNTPVMLLVQGSVNIAGTIDVSGEDAPGAGSAGTGNLSDDKQPGAGGPGGYDSGCPKIRPFVSSQ